MALTSGGRLGVYEVRELIGAGGMGQVYRGQDTRLNRSVALKILPAMFAANADRLARFKREAQVLASLNHPNIAAIFGFEEAEEVQALILDSSRDRRWAKLDIRGLQVSVNDAQGSGCCTLRLATSRHRTSSCCRRQASRCQRRS